jgi:multiple sugar transport system substrate-binding protein
VPHHLSSGQYSRSDHTSAPARLRLRRALSAGAAFAAVALTVAACGGSSSNSSVAASAKQTITFAESGLGTEGQQTQKAITDFEKANPNITVHIQVLSPDSTTYLQQLEHAFIAGSSTPDVFESDVTYPAKFAQAGWVLPLTKFNPNTGQFFPTEMAAAEYQSKPYAIPWFDNPEGLFYRTDLVPSPPTSPAQIVSDAKAAMAKDHTLKEGLAFEGAKYEGAITSFLTADAPFGGKLTLSSVDSSGNVAALKWLHDAIYVNKIAPQAVTGWQEGQVQQEFTSGYTAFAIDYPFVESVAASGGPAKGHVGYIPFPAGPGGSPGSALGGEMLAINAKTGHAAAAWKLIQYLTSPSVEIARAEATGDPPSLPSAYTSALYAKAPYFKDVKTLNQYAQPRPVDPNYLQASVDLQNAFSAVYANSASPSSALSSAASQIKSLRSGS